MKKIIKKFLPSWILLRMRYIYDRFIVNRLLSSEDRGFHRDYENKYVDKKCFIIGAGSSIKRQDLSMLAGQFSITVSNVFVHPEIGAICPMFHVLPNVFQSHGHLYGEDKFISWFEEMDDKLPKSTVMVLHALDKPIIKKNRLFLEREVFWYGTKLWDEGAIVKIDPVCLPNIWSVSEVALSLAIYFGFSEINLLGFDHDWFNGPMVYFYDKKDHKVGIEEKNVSFADSEFQMRRHAFIFKKYKALYALHGNIINCNANQNTYVDVFPRNSYEEALTTHFGNEV
jgi:hypothetical protein